MFIIEVIAIKGTAYITAPTKKSEEEIINSISQFVGESLIEVTSYEAGKMPLDRLPEAIQSEVKETLKAFPSTNVEYYNGEFHETTGCALRAKYPYDFFVAGHYTAKEVFTEEERKQNFIDSFGYEPRVKMW